MGLVIVADAADEFSDLFGGITIIQQDIIGFVSQGHRYALFQVKTNICKEINPVEVDQIDVEVGEFFRVIAYNKHIVPFGGFRHLNEFAWFNF
jgi:hypothetical protein